MNPLYLLTVAMMFTPAPQGDRSVRGTWGGPHASLELTADGGTLEFDCANGALSQGILTDRNGRFDVAGRYVEEHGGPVREKDQPSSIDVRYSGVVKGDRMTLTVTRADTKERLGTFTLERGRDALITKCR